MMGRQSDQIQMVILDIDSMIPEDHLLRQIKNCVNFDFIYEKAAPYYSHVGRKSIDPVVLIKMLLIGYLYGIKSERRLEEEVSLNLAYRWFCGIDLMNRVPDHSTFSQNRRRRFQEAGIFREIFNMILYLLLIVVATLLIVRYVGQRTMVSGSSMEPTLSHGDNLIVDKITYRFQDPVRYDIIVFPYKYEEDTYYIKRIIGLPGEKVQISEEGTIYINDQVLEEHYGNEVMKSPGIAAEPVFLGADEYFVLGDNRNASADSREPSVGVISGSDIVGRAWLRIWPLNKFGILRHQ